MSSCAHCKQGTKCPISLISSYNCAYVYIVGRRMRLIITVCFSAHTETNVLYIQNWLVAACAKLDPPIKSQNWISCASLDHVFYLNKYGMLFKPLHGFTRSVDSPMAYCCLPWIGSANVGSTSFLLNCCFSKLLSLSSQVFTRTKRLILVQYIYQPAF